MQRKSGTALIWRDSPTLIYFIMIMAAEDCLVQAPDIFFVPGAYHMGCSPQTRLD